VLRLLQEIEPIKHLLPPPPPCEITNTPITDQLQRTKNTVNIALEEITAHLNSITKLIQTSTNFQNIYTIVHVLQTMDQISNASL
jgi:hypothetical protein